jgi:hypothetical protein
MAVMVRSFLRERAIMTTMLEAVRRVKAPRTYYVVSFGIVLLLAAFCIPNLNRSRNAAIRSAMIPQPGISANEVDYRAYSPTAPQPAAFIQKEGITNSQAAGLTDSPDALAGRKIVRSAAIEMIVQHPAEVADQITAMAEKLGGYLVSADGAGQNATLATVTVRVPVAHFEEARAEIRGLGLRIENEKFDAQDVTQQYVDQTATIRNLQAQELQYLEI